MDLTNLVGTVTLANGVPMPYLGLGVYQTPAGQPVVDAVTYALDAGYRHIDTAAAYANEAGVGLAVRQHPTPRTDVFLTSKVWNADQGYDRTIRAFHASLRQLGTDYLDLYLQHWPVKGQVRATWRAMETLYQEGKIKAIGVCIPFWCSSPCWISAGNSTSRSRPGIRSCTGRRSACQSFRSWPLATSARWRSCCCAGPCKKAW